MAGHGAWLLCKLDSSGPVVSFVGVTFDGAIVITRLGRMSCLAEDRASPHLLVDGSYRLVSA
eukprot:2704792-Amphidinium_carterae.1